MSSAAATLADWLLRLESFSPHEIELGLDRTQVVLERLKLELPERIFHIAGTNGKGSSVAFAQALLQQGGFRVGAYTSPHIRDYNERICVDGVAASNAEIIAAFERVDAARGETPLTYFEFGTLAALIVFAERGVAVAVLEVGMGGRLDAVNAIEPTASLITNVSLDHCDWLGNDIETIALEKAGVMRPGKACVFAADDVPQAVLQHADTIGASLVLAGRDYSWQQAAESWSWQGAGRALAKLSLPSLQGDFQVANAAGVLALMEASGMHGLLECELVDTAFAKPRLAGRLQRVDAGRQWLLDVAHNPGSAEVLAATLAAEEFAGKTIAIVGTLDDKDVEGVCAPLDPHVAHWIAVRASNPRALPAAELARRVANINDRPCMLAATLEEAMLRAQELAGEDDRILVAGSFFLVGPVLEALGI